MKIWPSPVETTVAVTRSRILSDLQPASLYKAYSVDKKGTRIGQEARTIVHMSGAIVGHYHVFLLLVYSLLPVVTFCGEAVGACFEKKNLPLVCVFTAMLDEPLLVAFCNGLVARVHASAS